MNAARPLFALALTAGLVSSAVADPLSNPWVQCGTISSIGPNCQIAGRPLTAYEYGIAYNSVEVMPVICTGWNYGARIANKTPYFVLSDDPPAGMRYGGFVFYRGTRAADECPGLQNAYRHRYWYLGDGGSLVTVDWGNGCYTTLPVYCRTR